MSSLTLIDCKTIIVQAIEEVIETNLDRALDHIMVIDVSDPKSAWDAFRSEATTNFVGKWDILGFLELEVEIVEIEEEAYDLLWLEVEMDKYFLSHFSGEFDDNVAHAKEVKNNHNVARRVTKKQWRSERNNPAHVGVYEACVVHSHPKIMT